MQLRFLWIIVILLFCFFFYYFSAGYAVTPDLRYRLTDQVNPIEYNIEILDVKVKESPIIFDRLSADRSQELYVRVMDRYGKDVHGIMNYSINDSNNWTTIRMDLINGIPSNGTFRGIISDIKDNSLIKYDLYFEDEYGYVGSVSKKEGIFVTFTDKYLPTVKNLIIGSADHHKPIVVRANVYLPEGFIENVTLNYEIIQYPNGAGHIYYNLKEISNSTLMKRITPSDIWSNKSKRYISLGIYGNVF